MGRIPFVAYIFELLVFEPYTLSSQQKYNTKINKKYKYNTKINKKYI